MDNKKKTVIGVVILILLVTIGGVIYYAICKDAAVYFPKIDQDNWEREVNHIDKDNNPPYLRKVYIRKNN